METKQLKKCQPLKCTTFAKNATRPVGKNLTMEMVRPVDVFATACPYRNSNGTCRNEKESLTEKVY